MKLQKLSLVVLELIVSCNKVTNAGVLNRQGGENIQVVGNGSI